jgi:hypothetical protein
MGEPKFLPGPWRVDNDHRSGMAWNRHIVLDAEPDLRICFMAHSDGKAPKADKANAYLIAASPDLYEALAELVGDDFYQHPQDFTEPWHKAAAALAKARGETP